MGGSDLGVGLSMASVWRDLSVLLTASAALIWVGGALTLIIWMSMSPLKGEEEGEAKRLLEQYGDHGREGEEFPLCSRGASSLKVEAFGTVASASLLNGRGEKSELGRIDPFAPELRRRDTALVGGRTSGFRVEAIEMGLSLYGADGIRSDLGSTRSELNHRETHSSFRDQFQGWEISQTRSGIRVDETERETELEKLEGKVGMQDASRMKTLLESEGKYWADEWSDESKGWRDEKRLSEGSSWLGSSKRSEDVIAAENRTRDGDFAESNGVYEEGNYEKISWEGHNNMISAKTSMLNVVGNAVLTSDLLPRAVDEKFVNSEEYIETHVKEDKDPFIDGLDSKVTITEQVLAGTVVEEKRDYLMTQASDEKGKDVGSHCITQEVDMKGFEEEEIVKAIEGEFGQVPEAGAEREAEEEKIIVERGENGTFSILETEKLISAISGIQEIGDDTADKLHSIIGEDEQQVEITQISSGQVQEVHQKKLQIDSELDVASRVQNNVEIKPLFSKESEPEPKPEPEAKLEMEPKPETQPEITPFPESETNLELRSEPDSEPVLDSGTKPISEIEINPESRAETKLETEAKVEAVLQLKPLESEVKPEIEGKFETVELGLDDGDRNEAIVNVSNEEVTEEEKVVREKGEVEVQKIEEVKVVEEELDSSVKKVPGFLNESMAELSHGAKSLTETVLNVKEENVSELVRMEEEISGLTATVEAALVVKEMMYTGKEGLNLEDGLKVPVPLAEENVKEQDTRIPQKEADSTLVLANLEESSGKRTVLYRDPTLSIPHEEAILQPESPRAQKLNVFPEKQLTDATTSTSVEVRLQSKSDVQFSVSETAKLQGMGGFINSHDLGSDSIALDKSDEDADVDADIDGWDGPAEDANQDEPSILLTSGPSPPNSMTFGDGTGSSRSWKSLESDIINATGGSGSGSLARLSSGLGRGARRQFTMILDEFWSKVYDLHGQPACSSSSSKGGKGHSGGGGSNNGRGLSHLFDSEGQPPMKALRISGRGDISYDGQVDGYGRSLSHPNSSSSPSSRQFATLSHVPRPSSRSRNNSGLAEGPSRSTPGLFADLAGYFNDGEFDPNVVFNSTHVPTTRTVYPSGRRPGSALQATNRSQSTHLTSNTPLTAGRSPYGSPPSGHASPGYSNSELSNYDQLSQNEAQVFLGYNDMEAAIEAQARIQVQRLVNPYDPMGQHHSNRGLGDGNFNDGSAIHELDLNVRSMRGGGGGGGGGTLWDSSPSGFGSSGGSPPDVLGGGGLKGRRSVDPDADSYQRQQLIETQRAYEGRSTEGRIHSQHEQFNSSPLVFDELVPSKRLKEGFSLQHPQTGGNPMQSFWTRQPHETLFGPQDGQISNRDSDFSDVLRPPGGSPERGHPTKESEAMASFKSCLHRLLLVEGSDWLFRFETGGDEDLIACVAFQENQFGSKDSPNAGQVGQGGVGGVAVAPSSSRGSGGREKGNFGSHSESGGNDLIGWNLWTCGEKCVWNPSLIISFGVWCVHRILELSQMESRPELWGKYTYVLNRLQGILDPAFSKPRSIPLLCKCFKDKAGMEPISLRPPLPINSHLDFVHGFNQGGWPWQAGGPVYSKTKAPSSQLILDMIKEVESAVGARKGRTGTAAGDVAFPKGKENLASVLKRYKRRLANRSLTRRKERWRKLFRCFGIIEEGGRRKDPLGSVFFLFLVLRFSGSSQGFVYRKKYRADNSKKLAHLK